MGILDSLFGGGDQSQQPQQPQPPQLPQLGFKDRMQAIYSPGLYGARQAAYERGAAQRVETGVDPLTGRKTFAQQKIGPGGNLQIQDVPIGSPGQTPGTPGAPGVAGSEPLSMDTFKKAAEAGVTGEALYDHMPQGARETVKSMIEGRTALSPMSLRNPAMLPYLQAANIIDPTFDMSNPGARAAAMKSWKAGPDSETQRALNQALLHIGKMTDAAGNLPSHAVPAANTVENLFRNRVMGQGNTTKFSIEAHAAAAELGKVWKSGGRLSDTEIRNWEQNLSPDMSKEQQQKAVQAFMELLDGGLQSLQDKRIQGIGKIGSEKLGPLMTQEGKKAYDRVNNWAGGESTPQATPEIRVDAKGNKWMKNAQGQVVPYTGR